MSKHQDLKTIKSSSQFKLFKKITSGFLRLSISQKLHLGFFPLIVLIVFISVFALAKLNQLTILNESIMGVNIPAQEDIEELREIVIDQESIIRRYMILKDEDFLKKHLPDFDFLGFIPYDSDLIEADLEGISPYDTDAQAKAVVSGMIDKLMNS